MPVSPSLAIVFQLLFNERISRDCATADEQASNRRKRQVYVLFICTDQFAKIKNLRGLILPADILLLYHDSELLPLPYHLLMIASTQFTVFPVLYPEVHPPLARIPFTVPLGNDESNAGSRSI